MVHIERSALVLYTAEQMFDLVNDVAGYPAFLPGVVRTQVHEQSSDHMRATMVMKRAGVSAELTTSNRLQRPENIHMTLDTGPFQSLQGVWTFQNLGDLGSKVSLDLTFEPEARVVGQLAGVMLGHIGAQMVNEFCKQATKQYD